MYTELIMRLAGATAEEAPLVEEGMREMRPTLDGLDRDSFRSEARIVLNALRADPEYRAVLQTTCEMMGGSR